MIRRSLLFIATNVALCWLCYYKALNCGFVFDDISAIVENKDLRPHTPIKNLLFNDFWGTPIIKEQSHKSYRPLCVLTFRLNYMIQELNPLSYHLINIILHMITSLMLLRMYSFFLPEWASFAASLLFSSHPVHTEAVVGIVGRAELLSSVFFLAAFFCYQKCSFSKSSTDWLYFSLFCLFVTLATSSKEQGITVVGICVIYELFIVQKFKQFFVGSKSSDNQVIKYQWKTALIARISSVLLFCCFLLFIRMQIMGSQLPVFTRFDNPAAVASTPTRQLTYNYLLSVNAWLLMFPSNLCCDWTMGTIPLLESFYDGRIFAILFMYTILFSLIFASISSTLEQERRILIMSISFLILPFIPASNLFFPVGFVIAERVLYIPSMGFCMLISYGWWKLLQLGILRKVFVSLGVFIIIIFCMKCILRTVDWTSEYSIFMAGLRINQRNAKLFNNVGHALEGQGKFYEALSYFQNAVRVQGDDIGAHINVGRTFNNLKMYSEAEAAYLKAKSLLPKPKPGETYQARIAPNHLNVFLNLANLISRNSSRLEEADLLYRQAIAMRSDYIQAYINRGDILLKLNRTREAQEVYEKALSYDNSNPDIYYNLGVVFLEQGKMPEALAYLNKALEFDPNHQQALLNSAILMQELGEAELREKARVRLLRLLERNASDEKIYFNLGMLAMDVENISEAEESFRKAIEIKPDFRSALFNLALLLSDAHRPLEAVPFLHQLMKHHPEHIKGLILLGDIYLNTIRNLDAAANSYRRILEIDPSHIQGLHNLCVVHVEKGELLEAEKCFENALRAAPNEEYISRHLRIVQNRLRRLKTHCSNDNCLMNGSSANDPPTTSGQDFSSRNVS